MSTSRKISVRKIIQTLVTLVAATGCTLAMLSADRQQRERKVRDVKLKIHSPGGVQFLTDEEVRSMLFTKRHLNPQKVAVSRLDEHSMEAILQSNPWVKDAQVFTDAERIMHVQVTQRVPIVRLFEEDGNSYYLDTALQAMPLSTRYTHYTPVVTGVPRLANDSGARVVKGTIVGLVDNLMRHPFWKEQVTQVVMGDEGFELVPVLGSQRIIIGDTARLEEKLGNLFAFYQQVHNKVGWDRYRTIDLRYEGQVVASPALAWKAPVDRAISNMSWLKAIMDGAPARQSQPGGDASAFSDSTAALAPPKPKHAVAATPVASAPAAAKKEPPRRANQPVAVPKSPAAAKPKLPSIEARKKQATPLPKKTSSHAKNTQPHAATNR